MQQSNDQQAVAQPPASSSACRTNPSSGRFEVLDALRGIAILSVLAVHILARGNESSDQIIFPLLWPIAKHGYLGVDLFFMISGYCITLAALRGFDTSNPPYVFMMRRILRIFPPYYCGILLVVLLACINIFILKQPYSEMTNLTLLDWFANLTLLQGVFHTPDLSLPFWSLTVEFQFYLLVCLLMVLGRKHFLLGLSLASLTMVGLRFAIPTFSRNYLPDILFHWPPFVCGMITLLLCDTKFRHSASLILLIFSVFLSLVLSTIEDYFFLNSGHPYHLNATQHCLLVILAIPFFVMLYRYDGRIMSWKITKFLSHFGLISFSLYLTHIPISTRVINLAYRYYGLNGMEWIPVISLALMISYLFALLFFYFIEKPSIALSSSAFRKPKIS